MSNITALVTGLSVTYWNTFRAFCGINKSIKSGRLFTMKNLLNFGCRVIRGSFEKRKVDFLIGGVQKGGTTALDSYLRPHPELCLGKEKEIHFFDNEFIFGFPKFVRDAWYHSHFPMCSLEMVKGEATPIYIWWRPAIRRIYKYNRKIKLVFIFRDPVSRAYSHWNMEVQRGNENRSFSKVIRQPLCKKNSDCVQDRVFSYVERGFYYEQIKEVYNFFPKDQVLCLKQDDLRAAPEIALEKIARYLGISPLREVKKREVHSRDYEEKIDPRDSEYLRNVYREDLRKFGDLIGWDISEWLTP